MPSIENAISKSSRIDFKHFLSGKAKEAGLLAHPNQPFVSESRLFCIRTGQKLRILILTN